MSQEHQMLDVSATNERILNQMTVSPMWKVDPDPKARLLEEYLLFLLLSQFAFKLSWQHWWQDKHN